MVRRPHAVIVICKDIYRRVRIESTDSFHFIYRTFFAPFLPQVRVILHDDFVFGHRDADCHGDDGGNDGDGFLSDPVSFPDSRHRRYQRRWFLTRSASLPRIRNVFAAGKDQLGRIVSVVTMWQYSVWAHYDDVSE